MELIPRFDFPVFYAVLTHELSGSGQKKVTQPNTLWPLLAENVEKLKFSARASDIVRGNRMPSAAYDAVKKMFDSWDRDTEWNAEEQRTGKKEAMRRLAEIIPEEKRQTTASNMRSVVGKCRVENFSEEEKEKQTAYNTIKDSMEKDHKNGDYLGYLAESFRFAFVCIPDNQCFNEYSKDAYEAMKKAVKALCQSPATFRNWSPDAPLRKKLEHASGMSMKLLPKNPFFFPCVRFDSGKGNDTASTAGEDKDTNLETLLQHKEDKAPRKLTEILADNHKEERFCLILGPGGAGKTTLFHECMKTLAGTTDNDPNSLIPIYLDLSAAPDVDCFVYDKNGRSTFIRHAVYYLIHTDTQRENISLPAADKWGNLPAANLEEYFDSRELCIFLDGLNEVSRSVLPRCGRSAFHMIREEIAGLAAKDKFRIFVTSRTEEVFPSATGTSVSPKLYEICGVDDEKIKETLKDHSQLSEQEIERVLADPRLLETLKRPLFLMMYCQLNETEASTPGEILRLFFHDRRDGLYSIQERNSRIEEAQRRQSGYALRQTFTAEQQAFILDFIIPAFAWKMGDRFYTDVEEIKNVIQSIRKDDSETSVRGNAGIQAFPKYRNPSDPNDLLYNTRSVAQGLRDLGFDSGENEFDFHTMTVQIIDYCVSVGVVEKSDQNIKMPQEVIRDYFACAHVINTFRIAEARWKTAKETDTEKRQAEAFACLCTVLKDKPLNPAVRTLIGEALGEHRNGPYFDEKDKKWHYYTDQKIKGSLRGLTEKMLDICCGRHGEELGYTVFNLLSVLAEVRPNRDLSGLNLNGIDLQLFNILGTRFSRPGLHATFVDSRIRMYPYCQEDISGMAYNAEKGRIITYSHSGTLYEWDENTLVCTDSRKLHNGGINALSFSSDGKSFYVASQDKQIIEWSLKNYSPKHMAVLAYKRIDQVIFGNDFQNDQVFVFVSTRDGDNSQIHILIYNRNLKLLHPARLLYSSPCTSYTSSLLIEDAIVYPDYGIIGLKIYTVNDWMCGYCSTLFLFDLNKEGKVTPKKLSNQCYFDKGIFCKNSPYILVLTNGILRKTDIRTLEDTVISDSFPGKLCNAYYNTNVRKYILKTEDRLLVTDTLVSLQNMEETPTLEHEFLPCENGSFIGTYDRDSFSPFAGGMNTIRIWNIQPLSKKGFVGHYLAGYVSLDVTENGEKLVALCMDGTLMQFSWDEKKKKYICFGIHTELYNEPHIRPLWRAWYPQSVWWTKDEKIFVYAFAHSYLVDPGKNESAKEVSSFVDYIHTLGGSEIGKVATIMTNPIYDKEQNKLYFINPDEKKSIFSFDNDDLRKIDETFLSSDVHELTCFNKSLLAAGRTFTLQEDGSIEIRDTASDTVLQTIPAISDLLIQGVDFSCLKDSSLTARDRDLLQMYGAKFGDNPGEEEE